MAEELEGEMVATYAVRVAGFAKVEQEMAELDAVIKSIRKTQYQPGVGSIPATTVSQARFGPSQADRLIGKRPGGGDDIFVASVEAVEGRVRGVVRDAMAKGMATGKRVQTATLRAAVTKTGLAGESHVRGRKGPGREDSGNMIQELATNVETQDVGNALNVVGWHGWARGRSAKIEAQEQGTKGRRSGQQKGSLKRKVRTRKERASGAGVPAANSLGAAIIIVREQLKRDLGGLKR